MYDWQGMLSYSSASTGNSPTFGQRACAADLSLRISASGDRLGDALLLLQPPLQLRTLLPGRGSRRHRLRSLRGRHRQLCVAVT